MVCTKFVYFTWFIDMNQIMQMSLLILSEGDRMELPPGIGVIRDIQIAPSGIHAPGRLALMASAGKKLTLLRFGFPIRHALM